MEEKAPWPLRLFWRCTRYSTLPLNRPLLEQETLLDLMEYCATAYNMPQRGEAGPAYNDLFFALLPYDDEGVALEKLSKRNG